MSVVIDTSSKELLSMNGGPACGAKTRAGGKCKAIGIKPSGRCQRHGGKSLSGPASATFKDGHRSKYLYLPATLTARIENLTYDSIGNLEDSVKTHIALETRINEEFSEGCSLERWQEVKELQKSYQRAVDEGSNPSSSECLDKVFALVDQGLQDARNEELLAERLRTNHEAQRKLSDSISKIRKESQETYTYEQWSSFMVVQLNILREVLEGKQMQNYLDKVRHFTDKNPKQLKG